MALITLEVLRHKFNVVMRPLPRRPRCPYLMIFRVEALQHTHDGVKRDGMSGEGHDGGTAARTHSDGFGAVLSASYGYAG